MATNSLCNIPILVVKESDAPIELASIWRSWMRPWSQFTLWIVWSHWDKALCMLVGEFVGKVSWGGKPHPKCGWHCSMGWVLDWIKRRMLGRCHHLSLYLLTSETVWLSLSPFCSQGGQQRPPLPEVLLVRHLVTIMRLGKTTIEVASAHFLGTDSSSISWFIMLDPKSIVYSLFLIFFQSGLTK